MQRAHPPAPKPRPLLAGALLSDARHRAGLTQAYLAERSGVVRPLISQYETGKKDPSVTMLARLIEACGMELRMRADVLTEADRDQYERDAAVGPVQARRNADRARREVLSIRKLTPEEIDRLRSGDRATS
ncbi:MAG: helix-turn-helix domain-containing protein [Acidimicrobiales bacterium]